MDLILRLIKHITAQKLVALRDDLMHIHSRRTQLPVLRYNGNRTICIRWESKSVGNVRVLPFDRPSKQAIHATFVSRDDDDGQQSVHLKKAEASLCWSRRRNHAREMLLLSPVQYLSFLSEQEGEGRDACLVLVTLASRLVFCQGLCFGHPCAMRSRKNEKKEAHVLVAKLEDRVEDRWKKQRVWAG